MYSVPHSGVANEPPSSIDVCWRLLEDFAAGDATVPQQLHQIHRSSVCHTFSAQTTPEGRSALSCLPPMLLQRVWQCWTAQTAPPSSPSLPSSVVVLVAIMNRLYIVSDIAAATAQPLDCRPTQLEELTDFYTQVLLHPQCPEACYRQLLHCIAMLEMFLRSPTDIVAAIAYRSSSSPHEAGGGSAPVLRSLHFWCATLDLLADDRVRMGSMRRALCSQQLCKEATVLLQYTEAALRPPPQCLSLSLGPETLPFCMRAVTRLMDLISRTNSVEPYDSCSSLWNALPNSGLLQDVRQLLVTPPSRRHPTQSHVSCEEDAIELLCTIARLCTAVEEECMATLLMVTLEIAEEVGKDGTSRSLSVACRLCAAAMENLAPVVVSADLRGESGPLLQAFSRGSETVLAVLRGCTPTSEEEEETYQCAASALLCLCEDLREDPVPAMEPTDDVEDYQMIVAEMESSNAIKRQALQRLRTYLVECQDAVSHCLEHLLYLKNTVLHEVSDLILSGEDLLLVPLHSCLITSWVAYERLYEVLGGLPPSLDGSTRWVSILQKLPSRKAILAHVTEYLPAAMQRSSYTGLLLDGCRAEAALLPAAVLRCFPSGEQQPRTFPDINSIGMVMSGVLAAFVGCGDVLSASYAARALELVLERLPLAFDTGVTSPLAFVPVAAEQLWALLALNAGALPLKVSVNVSDALGLCCLNDETVGREVLRLVCQQPIRSAAARLKLKTTLSVVEVSHEGVSEEVLLSDILAALVEWEEAHEPEAERMRYIHSVSVGITARFRESSSSALCHPAWLDRLGQWYSAHSDAILLFPALTERTPPPLRASFLSAALCYYLATHESSSSAFLRELFGSHTLQHITMEVRSQPDAAITLMNEMMSRLASQEAASDTADALVPSEIAFLTLLEALIRCCWDAYRGLVQSVPKALNSADQHSFTAVAEYDCDVHRAWCDDRLLELPMERECLRTIGVVAFRSLQFSRCSQWINDNSEGSPSSTTATIRQSIRNQLSYLTGCAVPYCRLWGVEAPPALRALAQAADCFDRRALILADKLPLSG